MLFPLSFELWLLKVLELEQFRYYLQENLEHKRINNLGKTLKAKFLIALQTVALYPDYEQLHYKKRAKARSLHIVYFL